MDDLTDSDIIVLAAHFSGTTAGKIVSAPMAQNLIYWINFYEQNHYRF
ncbi:MAG: hypothetical protein Ct9H300mP4_03870 [Gammaproteobacteria bacterium]|nr:MAG: hypothetical protein Ct9H300mP4_03870 [Gammaproteobacteria bacterium]